MAKAAQLSLLCMAAMIVASCHTQPKTDAAATGQAIAAKQQDSIAPQQIVHAPADTLKQITKADSTKAWVDSLDGIIRKGEPHNDYGKAFERRQLQWAKACNALGDYYLVQYHSGNKAGITKALKYYELISDINVHDDFLPVVQQRVRACRQIAALYNSRLLPIKSVSHVFVSHYINPSLVTIQSSFNGVMTDSSGPCIRYLFGNSSLTACARKVLDTAAIIINQQPAKKIVISSGGAGSETTQQFCWDQTNTVVHYLVEKKSVPLTRIIFRYDGPEAPGSTVVRFAKEGEDGEPRQAPPRPGLIDWLGNYPKNLYL